MVIGKNIIDIKQRIEQLGGSYDPVSTLTIDDQLLICESVKESTPIKPIFKNIEDLTNKNVSVSGVNNDSNKLTANFELTQNKLQLIQKLKTFNYKTPPNQISPILEEFFKEWPSFSTHWSYITQTYTPKTIKSVLNRIVKLYCSGYSIDNPPGLFTLIIKKRHKRKNKFSYQ